MNALEWLLDSDPAIRWQAMHDLTDAPPEAVVSDRARVAREGLGAEILARQEPDGSWRRVGTPAWQSTLFTLLLLRSTGVDREDAVVQLALARAETNLRWNDHGGCWDLRSPEFDGNSVFDGEEEPCINGGVLALAGYFGRPSGNLARRLLQEQLDDGGWNCDAPKSRVSSFHTTICVLEGLLEYERAVEGSAEVLAARRRGEQYLLDRSLFRRKSTGELASPEFLELAFPPRYRYDVLRALDYFRAAGATPDARIRDAVKILDGKRKLDGRWLLDRAYDESLAVRVGEAVGEPSRWNTLRALRVLRWYRGNDQTDGTSRRVGQWLA